MLEIIQFRDTLRYGIINRFTGTVILKPCGKRYVPYSYRIVNRFTGRVILKPRDKRYVPYSYRSKKRAIRKMHKLAKHFNQTVRSLSK